MQKPQKDRSLMKLGAILGVGFILLVAGNVYSFLSRFSGTPKQSETVLEKWETTNGHFRIRITEFGEDNAWPIPGAYFVYQSAPAGSEDWKHILTLRQDDPAPISGWRTRFVNDRVAYVFTTDDFAATTDGGLTWSPSKWPMLTRIHEVAIFPDGSGHKTFSREGGTKLETMTTTDFGRHWTVASD